MNDRCQQMQARCLCCLPLGHETPHVCTCGGAFLRIGEDLLVYDFPSGRDLYYDEETALQAAVRFAKAGPIFRERA